jgi:hypothetical protein
MTPAERPTVMEPPKPRAVGRRRPPRPQVSRASVAMVSGAVAYVAFRAWSVAAGSPQLWPDSPIYQQVARSSLSSTDLWAGRRPPLMPLLYKLAGSSDRFIWLQVAVSCACWLFLAFVMMRYVPSRSRLTVGAIVLVFSCATPIIQWDRLVLSESIAISTMVAVVASVLLLIERVSPVRAIAVGVALVAFTVVRDTDLVVTVAGGVLLLILCAVLHFRQHRRGLLPLVLLGLVALGAAGVTSAVQYVKRDAEPMRNILSARILPYPDRLDWFADHGMPDAAALRRLAAKRQVAVGPLLNSPATAAYRSWVADHDAARTYRTWLLTHPFYVVTAPFDNVGASNSISHYRPPHFRGLPGPVSSVLFPTGWWLALWGGVILIAGSLRRCWSSVVWRVASVLALLAVPHALAAWHGDAVELERHLFLASLQVRLAIVLATCVVLVDLLRRRSGTGVPQLFESPRATELVELGG